eukprot:PLAT13710.1.p1 GENE.PLAT13710.1~~PLAT13710.1.p1  ORF type:complete len:784 (-),score=280.64 PLAT13710.1:46-2361(-)
MSDDAPSHAAAAAVAAEESKEDAGHGAVVPAEGCCAPAARITDRMEEELREGRMVLSFEFFPAKTEEGLTNLLARVGDMGQSLQPTFVSLTWRAVWEDARLSLRIASYVQSNFHIPVLLHLTCHLPRDRIAAILQSAKDAGIRNILALRGDPQMGRSSWKVVKGGFSNAIQLVRLIRSLHGDYFCVAVAGYPEVHVDCWNSPYLPPSQKCRERDLANLKKKVEAGADFVLTQFVFDAEVFLTFERTARKAGIKVPIVPGYLPIQSWKTFRQFTTWCKTTVPQTLSRKLARLRDDDDAVRTFGVEQGVDTLRRLQEAGVRAVHFFTLNLRRVVTEIVFGLGLRTRVHESHMPWGTKRSSEGVRPIFWSQRPESYLTRTAAWDEYPNGRWGDRRSPAYGELKDYYLARRAKVDRRAIWGSPKSVQDVCDVFVGYLSGRVKQLPWSDSGLALETSLIRRNLLQLNSHGFLTINSQPRVNGASSSDPQVGWGSADGHVFQKAYIEFFACPEQLHALLAAFHRFPSLAYHAMNKAGEEYCNYAGDRAIAVTWGVFPGREILQPTVVDGSSFRYWKDEAFALWLQWASLYDGDDSAADSAELIHSIHDNWFLVNIVDNDFSDSSDIFSIFKAVIADGMSREQLRARVSELEAENDALQTAMSKLEALRSEEDKELATAVAEVARLQALLAAERMKTRKKNRGRLLRRSSPLSKHASSPSAAPVSASASLPALSPSASVTLSVAAALPSALPPPARKRDEELPTSPLPMPRGRDDCGV